jgi:hypothetical protein
MADVILNITVKDAYVARLVTAVQQYANKNIEIRVLDNPIKISEMPWVYDSQQSGETLKQFGERMIRKFLIAFVKHYEYNTDVQRYKDDVAAILPPDEDVPGDIVE